MKQIPMFVMVLRSALITNVWVSSACQVPAVLLCRSYSCRDEGETHCCHLFGTRCSTLHYPMCARVPAHLSLVHSLRTTGRPHPDGQQQMPFRLPNAIGATADAKHCLCQFFPTLVRPRPGKLFFHKTRARPGPVPTDLLVNSFPFFFKFIH